MNAVVNDLIINYQDTGKKTDKTVVFIHGWADDSSTFDSLISRLSSHYRCIALDLPGFGKSEIPKKALTLEDFSGFVADFLHKINVSPFAAVGHSNGGAIAINAASSKKINPKKIILIASAGLRNNRKAKKMIYKVLAKPARASLAVLPRRKREAIKKKLYARIGSDYLLSEHMKETFKNIVAYDISSEAAALKTPVFLIYGSEDTSTPPEMGNKLHKLIKGSDFEVIEGAGHFIHQNFPDKIIRQIEQFLK